MNVDNGEEEKWIASTHDMRQRKKTIKNSCDSIASQGHFCPYVVMTKDPRYTLRGMYTSNIWRESYWKSGDKLLYIMEEVIELQKQLRSSVTPQIKALINSDACQSTINRTINLMRRNGFLVCKEVNTMEREGKNHSTGIQKRQRHYLSNICPMIQK